MFKKLILSFFVETILIVQCSLLCACGNERGAARSIDDIVAAFTQELKGSDGIANFGLTKSGELGYKNLQLLESRSKELKDFGPLLLEYISKADADINIMGSMPIGDPRIRAIVEFLQSSSGIILKNDYKQLYGLLLCCVRQKLQPIAVEPFIVEEKKTIPVPIRKAIEECINRMNKALTSVNVKEPRMQDCVPAQTTIESIVCSNSLTAQTRVLKALNDSLREIGAVEVGANSFSNAQGITQLSTLATNPVIGDIFKLCFQQDYSGALELLNKTYTSDDLLTQRFKESLDALIQGNFTQFDPQIGDELCEVRALLLPLLRDGKSDLPCLNMFFGSRTDLAALFIVASYLLTMPLPGINGFNGKSLQPLIDTLCGTDGYNSRLREGSYAALKKFLSSISILFLREMSQESGDNDLILGCNNVFLNAKGCLTMPFYCSIKALVYALKRYKLPVVFRIMKVTGYAQNSSTEQELSTGPCCYVASTEQPRGAALIYECKNVPAGVEYRRAKMSSRDEQCDCPYGASCAQMIRSYGIDKIILQDAAQHDQLINPSVEMLKKMCPYIEYVPQKNVKCEMLKKEIERQIILKLFSQCGRLADEYQTCCASAWEAKMDEERKCQQDKAASRQEEIKLIVSHVFASDAQSYLSQRLGNKMQAGRKVCCL